MAEFNENARVKIRFFEKIVQWALQFLK